MDEEDFVKTEWQERRQNGRKKQESEEIPRNARCISLEDDERRT